MEKMLELINQIFKKIEALEKKLTNHYKKYLKVLKRIKKLEEK